MKKYLMTGIAALTMCAGFTSCSHDLSLPTQQDINELVAQKVTDNYNRAFIDKFGQPAENQDWGFGSVSNARAITRAIQPSFNFPSDADASKFLADVPADVEKLSQNVGVQITGLTKLGQESSISGEQVPQRMVGLLKAVRSMLRVTAISQIENSILLATLNYTWLREQR